MRLALIGTGAISHRFLLQAGPDRPAQFVATCAQHLASAEARAVEFGIESWYDDWEALYDEVRPDGVVVTTPNAIHPEPTIAALERGIHVLCEKPMATTWKDCLAVAAAARGSDATLLCLPYDARPGYRKVIEHLNEETIGRFTGAEAQLLWPGPPTDDWYYDPELSGGGIDTLVYPVCRLLGLLGPAKRVTGMANNLLPRRILSAAEPEGFDPRALVPKREGQEVIETEVLDNITLTVEWASGQQAVLRTLWSASVLRLDTTVYGRQGTLWFNDWFGGQELVVQSPHRAVPGAELVDRLGYVDCYQVPLVAEGAPNPLDFANEGLLDHFVECAEGKAVPTCGIEQQLHGHEIVFKGLEAAVSGSTQELETTFAPWHPIEPGFDDTRSRPT